MTDETEKETNNQTLLCVDNVSTVVELVQYPPTEEGVEGRAVLDVEIGSLFPFGRILHGEGDTNYNPSVGTVIGHFGFHDNANIEEGLNMIHQRLAEEAACLPQAVELAHEEIETYYNDLAESINPNISEVNVSFRNDIEANPVSLPEGRADEELAEMGFVFPDAVDIDIEPIVCDVTIVDEELRQRESDPNTSTERAEGPGRAFVEAPRE